VATVSGGDKLAAKLAEIAARLGQNPEVHVGFLENATYPNGTPVAMVAAIQEFGAPKVGIPPRPFMRNAVAAHKAEWPKAAADLLKATDYDVHKTLELVGEGIKGQIQQSISDLMEPPLGPVTLMLRMMRIGNVNAPVTFAMVREARRRVAAGERASGVSTKPLIDTGHLFASVDYEVIT
jgi:hypothetical protein